MHDRPKISIITPTFNHAHFIERTIASVLDQRYPNLEYIIMDGGSTDGTIDILRKYEGQLQWFSEKDEGQADAINKGISKATGDIIAYLNSDDLYAQGALETVGSFFSDHPDAMWVTGKCRVIDEQDREVRRPVTAYKNFLLQRFSYPLLLVTNPISQPATFWRRKVTEECGPFDKEQHFVMDYDYWLRVGKHYPLALIQDYLASFRVYTSSKTSSSFLRSFRQELEVARQHTDSAFLIGLHWLNYFCIAAAYLLMNGLARTGRK